MDNLDLLRFGPPLAVSVINFPYAKSTGSKASTAIPDEVAVFFAGRITPKVGAFVEPKWARDSGQFTLELVKLGSATRVGMSDIAGIALVKGDATAADPFNTIRFTAYHTISAPAVFLGDGRPSGGDLFNFSDTENLGGIAYGRFFNTLYAAAGTFRGDGASSTVEEDPMDFYGRVVLERAFTAETVASLGGFYYGGKQRYDHTADPVAGPAYESTFHRWAVDAQYQLDSAPHIVDAVALYVNGKDENVWDGAGGRGDVTYDGFYGELSYFYDRQYGVTVGYDHLKSDEDPSLDKKGPTVNLTYFPWLNTKLSVEYSHFEFSGGDTREDVTFLVHLYY
jgi:hypothetical protein